jgi:hypothetical protein
MTKLEQLALEQENLLARIKAETHDPVLVALRYYEGLLQQFSEQQRIAREQLTKHRER